MKVSIVTPSFNQARYLEQTMRSVLEQGYSDLEYFVIDGGSNDGSAALIERYAGQLSGWVSEKDKGQADAINKGLRQCSGEIVAWLNSDDYYVPGAIVRAVDVFKKHPEAGLVYGNVLSVDANSQPFNLQTFQLSNLTDLMSFRIISQPAVFMRRAVLERAGLLDESYHLLLDHHLWLRMARHAPIVHIPETLAAARYHAEAKNLARTADFGREAYRIVDWLASDLAYADEFKRHERRIRGGAQRLDAFYQLDGGHYATAFKTYLKAFSNSPKIVLREAHRVLFALLGLIGLGNLRGAYVDLRKKRLGIK